MSFLSDDALDRLRNVADLPDLSSTRYRIVERVARGGMGVVYAAHDESLQRRVALKVLDDPDPTGQLADRLVREAHVLARLEHPGIVPVHDVGTLPDNRVFYTMKFVEGRRLDKHLQGVPSVPDRLRLFLRICDAVAFAHSRGVLHRDLNPQNVMVGSFGEVLVMDWGLAKIFRRLADGQIPETQSTDTGTHTVSEMQEPKPQEISGMTGHGTVMGTPGYMSPEQARGESSQVDERSDVFSLGKVLQFLVTLNPSSADLSPAKPLVAIFTRAAATSPAARYSSVADLAADVSRYLDGQPVSAYRERLVDRVARFYRRYNVAILLITVYLLTRVALLLIWHH